jgi:hypothetical protein
MNHLESKKFSYKRDNNNYLSYVFFRLFVSKLIQVILIMIHSSVDSLIQRINCVPYDS